MKVVSVVSRRGAIQRMLRRPRIWVWLSVTTLLLGLAVSPIPLFNVLGFELAIGVSIVAAIAGLDLGAALARELQWLQSPVVLRANYPGRALALTTFAAAVLATVVMLPPALIAAVRGLWIPTCDWWFGIKAYLMLPLATAALAGALGHVIGVAVGAQAPDTARRDRWFGLGFAGAIGVAIAIVLAIVGTIEGALLVGGAVAVALAGTTWVLKPHRSTLAALVPVLVFAGSALYRFYATPPVFTYNPIIGYFPGNLYDENVELGLPLLWSRLEQLAWVLAIVNIVAARLDVPRFRISRQPRPDGLRVAPALFAVACVAGGVTLHVLAGDLGYRIDGGEIQEELGGEVETEHFVIHYAKTPEIERDISLVAADHELRYAQVVAQLGAAPPGKLRSYLFATREQKARWIGAKDVEMAKPWRREIYLEHRAFPHGSLRHEIAHAVASAFGDPVFGVAAQRIAGVPILISPGLIEGLAVAVDWPAGYDRLTPHEAVRAMQAMGMTPTIRELLSLRFLTVSSARSYTTAGSFLRFLLDKYGAPSLRTLYGTGGDFQRAYGKSISVLETEWRAMLGEISLPVEEIEGTRERFRAGSVFARPCPHANAARRERAVKAWADGDRPRAVALLRAVCADAPDEPRYRLELGDFLAGGSIWEYAEAVALWTAVAETETVTSSLRADALDRMARRAAAIGDMKRATELIARARELPVDPNARRQLEAQWFALHHDGKAGSALRGYFFAPPGTWDGPSWALLATLAEPELGMGHYLLGLQKGIAGEWQEAAEALDTSLTAGLPSISFRKNAARRLAVVAFRANDIERVERAIETLRGADMNETDRLLADDWAQRLTFAATGRLSK